MSLKQEAPENVASHGLRSIDWHRSRFDLWHLFCERYRVAEDSVPLFECDESGLVLTKEIGTARRRKILRRSSAMEAMMRQEAKKAIDDHESSPDAHARR
jgi:hypothetical protein